MIGVGTLNKYKIKHMLKQKRSFSMGLESQSLLLPCQNPGVRAAVWTGMQSAGYTGARAAMPDEGEPKAGGQ